MRRLLQQIEYSQEWIKSRIKSAAIIPEKTQQLEFKLLNPSAAVGIKLPKKIAIPPIHYTYFQSYLFQFFNSTSQHGRVNGQQVTFVTGAPGVGKSTFIKGAISDFRSMKMQRNKNAMKEHAYGILDTPEYYENLQREHVFDNEYFIGVEIDCQKQPLMTPEAFFHRFRETILSHILSFNEQVKKQRPDIRLLDEFVILQIAISSNAPEYIQMCLQDTVFSIINGRDIIQLSEEGIETLQEINERLLDTHYSNLFHSLCNDLENMSTIYEELIILISTQLKITKLEAAIKLFVSIFMRTEYENRPHELYAAGWYETGIESCGFVMDILNYLSGFGEFNKAVLSEHIGSNPCKRFSQIFKNYYISSGNHIDAVVCLLHIENLSCYEDPKFVQWLDALLIRLHNQSNLRTHFPVLIQFQSNQTVKHIQKLGRYLPQNPTVLELPGYFIFTMHMNNLPYIFNAKAIDRLLPVLGRNPSVWNLAIQELAKGVPIEDILTRRASFMRIPELSNTFNSRVNKIYLDPNNLPFLDDNTLKFHVRFALKALNRCNGYWTTMFQYNDLILFENPVFASLWAPKTAVLFNHYYYFNTQPIDQRHMLAVKQFLNQPRTLSERLREFWWYRTGQGIRYRYWKRELHEQKKHEMERFKRVRHPAMRDEYLLQDYYFGFINEYKVSHLDRELKQKYNI